MRDETRPEGSSAVESVQASEPAMPASWASENHLWNCGMGELVSARSARERVPRVNCGAWPPLLPASPPGATV
jgi:hypothetical protein